VPSWDAVVARLTGPADAGLSCDACFDELDRYVEAARAGADADALVPGMREHLRACPACAEDERSLRALLAAQEAE
jgi:hypothetical protein